MKVRVSISVKVNPTNGIYETLVVPVFFGVIPIVSLWVSLHCAHGTGRRGHSGGVMLC